ncbi:MAG: sulfatase-like hydrolase/transferase, partial [Anaerolineae bacterium]|nr:sulfatase-like hydrolase/transferase [Anaerolineae bacterium]
ARMAEVFAGFISYTDHQIGRLLDFLEETGQMENTVIVVVSDNGASGEGTPDGSVNENKFFNGWPDDLQENLAKIDQLGSPDTYNHYPTGWAWAFNTPYKMFKRFSLEGGIADPCIIAWPRRTQDLGGAIRDQYHHAIDIVPTILDLVGVEAPEYIKGHPQSEIQGVSMAYTFDRAEAESRRETQYYAMLGTRAIYHKGWKAVARHGAISGKGNFNADPWELYHVAEDRSETHDLAEQHPEKVQELVNLWFSEAGKNNVFPLDDRTALELLTQERPEISAPRDSYVYYPHTAEVPEGVAANIRNRSFSIVAEADIASLEAEGVIFAHGARFGGHGLFIKAGKLYYVYNFLGIEEQQFVSGETIPSGKVAFGVEFEKTHEDPKFVANGTLKLYINDKVVAKGTMRTQPGKFALSGEGLAVGRDAADSVSKEYKPPFPFHGGAIEKVVVNVTGEHVIDLELEALGMLARE